MAFPLITLTTDFGLADHYVGTMKGVIFSRCPEARIVDISHQLPAFSIQACAYTISQAAPFFPPQTVHVIVVDPGVGTARRPLLVEALGQHFVAPDNGVLSFIAALDNNLTAREIMNRKLWLEPVSNTFHGRDIFAPVAAAIAGHAVAPEAVGPVIERIEVLDGLAPRQIQPGVWNGIVLSIDHFGNIITNFNTAEFPALAAHDFTLLAGSVTVDRFARTFGSGPPGICFAYFGSSGYIEIGMSQASAARHCAIHLGAPVTLRL